MQKIYYDAANNHRIIDVSGKKPEEEIRSKYPHPLQKFEVNRDDVFNNGVVRKRSEVDAEFLQGKKDKRDSATNRLKAKLNLSDDDINDLKTLLS